mgnify:FL=1
MHYSSFLTCGYKLYLEAYFEQKYFLCCSWHSQNLFRIGNMLLCGCAHQKGQAQKMLTLEFTPAQVRFLLSFTPSPFVFSDNPHFDYV